MQVTLEQTRMSKRRETDSRPGLVNRGWIEEERWVDREAYSSTGTGSVSLKSPWVVQEADEQFSCFVATQSVDDIQVLPDGLAQAITNLHRVNDVRDINSFLRKINGKLPAGGVYVGCAQTCELVKRTRFQGRPAWTVWPGYCASFLLHRVLPKLWATRALYFTLSKGENQAISKTEILGRLVYCGFEIVAYDEVGDELFFVVEKQCAPSEDVPPSSGSLLRMKRIGHHGRLVNFYKLRTMHPYAEYIQSHVHATNDLAPSGKFSDDYRVTTWGRFLRRTWLDELPMLINFLKGDLKLVGVRPLSKHYLGLYPKEMLAQRLRHKPGLIPAFYADLPVGFDAIIESESQYLDASERHPFLTDVRYLRKALWNIFRKRVRSQ